MAPAVPAAEPGRHLPPANRRRVLALAAIMSAAVMLGSMTPVARSVMDRGVSFLDLNAARAWVSLVLVGIVVVAAPRHARLRGPEPTSWLETPPLRRAIFVGSFGVCLGVTQLLSAYAVARLPVGIAVVIGYLAPGLVVLWKWGVGRVRPTRGIVSGLLLALFGIALLTGFFEVIAGDGLDLAPLALVAAFLTAVCFAALLLSGERLSRSIGASRAVFLGYAVAAGLWLLVQPIRGWVPTLADLSLVPGISYVAFIGTTGYLLLNWGMRYVEARIAGIIAMLEPVVAAFIAFIWLEQALRTEQIIGGLLVLAGASIVSLLPVTAVENRVVKTPTP